MLKRLVQIQLPAGKAKERPDREKKRVENDVLHAEIKLVRKYRKGKNKNWNIDNGMMMYHLCLSAAALIVGFLSFIHFFSSSVGAGLV